MFGLTTINNDFAPIKRSRNLSDFHNIIDNFFNDNFLPVDFRNDNFKMDIRENEDSYIIDAELPGVSKDEITIDYFNNQLSIAVKREEEKEESGDKYLHRERRFSSMQRSVYLPNIEMEDISASFKDGVLEIAAKKQVKKEISSKIEIQ